MGNINTNPEREEDTLVVNGRTDRVGVVERTRAVILRDDKNSIIAIRREVGVVVQPSDTFIRIEEYDTGRKECDGYWNQNVYRVIGRRKIYRRIDGTFYSVTIDTKKVFDHKLPRPDYPTIPFDCIVKHVYTDKYHSKIDYYNDVPLSKGSRIPKQLDQGYKWYLYIGDAFPRWDAKRTSPDRTQYYTSWDGTVITTDKGDIPLTW